jgi:hypothetical protein
LESNLLYNNAGNMVINNAGNMVINNTSNATSELTTFKELVLDSTMASFQPWKNPRMMGT